MNKFMINNKKTEGVCGNTPTCITYKYNPLALSSFCFKYIKYILLSDKIQHKNLNLFKMQKNINNNYCNIKKKLKYDLQDNSIAINNKKTEGNMTQKMHKENYEIFGDTELEFVYGHIKFDHAKQKKVKDFKSIDSEVYPKTMTYKKFVKWLADNKRPYELILAKENLKNSDIASIDFDGEHHTKKYIKETYPFLNTYVLSGNTKGYHYFVRNNIFKNYDNHMAKQFPEDKEIDLLSDYIWLKPTDWAKYKSHTNLIEEIELDDLDKISTVIRDRCEKKKYLEDLCPDLQDKIYSNINNDEISEIVNILSQDRSDCGQDWSQVIAALKKLYLKDLARQFSKKSDKHTDYEFENKWSSSNELSIGVVMNMAKQDNPIEYKKIRDKYKYSGLCLDLDDFDSSDKLCDKIFVYLQGKLVYDGKNWWSPINNLWTIISKPTRPIVCVLTAGWKTGDKKLSDKIQNTQDDKERGKLIEKRDELFIARKKLDNQSGIGHLANHLSTLLLDNQFVQKLDKFEYKIPFKNGIYDLKNKCFRHDIFDSDFITKTSHIEYDESYDEQKLEADTAKVRYELLKIFNNDENFYNYILSYIGCAFCSVPSINQTCLFNIGAGSNGKSKLLEILCEIFPNMVTKLTSELLQEKFDKPHKLLPKLGQYSLIYFEEYPDGKKINNSLIKDMVGSDKINTTKMYAEDQEIKIKSKIIINSNYMPTFQDMDFAIIRRFRAANYESTFRFDIEDNIEKKEYKINLNFTRDMLIYTQAIIRLIIKYASNFAETHDLPNPPEKQQEFTKQIIKDNDEIGEWLKNNIEKKSESKLSIREIMYKIEDECDEKPNRKKIRDLMKKKLGIEYKSKESHKNNQGVFVGVDFVEEQDVKQPDKK